MVRENDSVVEFRHAMQRIVDRLDKQDERINQAENTTLTHVLKCEAAGQSAARDLAELRIEMKALRDLVITVAKIGFPLLAFILAVQILGVERAWNVTDSIKALRHVIPIDP